MFALPEEARAIFKTAKAKVIMLTLLLTVIIVRFCAGSTFFCLASFTDSTVSNLSRAHRNQSKKKGFPRLSSLSEVLVLGKSRYSKLISDHILLYRA